MASSTARDVIIQAMLWLRVLPEGQSPTGNQLNDGLLRLNRMLHGLKANGADLEYQDITLADDVPLPPEHLEACEYLLASKMAPQYATELIPEVAIEARRARSIFQAAYGVNPTLYPDAGITDRLSPYVGRWNIYSGR